MTTTVEIVDFVRQTARGAADEIAAFLGPQGFAELEVEAETMLALSKGASASGDHRRRETWEHHAALNLLLAARCILGRPDDS